MLKLINLYKVKHNSLDKFVIYESETNVLVQYDFDVLRVRYNREILNEHEKRNGRNPVYKWCGLEKCEIEGYIKNYY